MCWSTEVSLISFIIVLLIVYYILKQNPDSNYKWQCYFVMAFITIQALEAILWQSINKKNDKLNATITAIVLIALWCQPFINCYFGYKIGNVSNNNKTILMISSIIFGSIIIYNIIKILAGGIKFKTFTTKSCHLNWTRSDSNGFMSDPNIPFLPILYLGGLMIPLLMMMPRKLGLSLFGIGIVTLIIAMKFYRADGSFSSMWCFLAIFYVLGLLLLFHKT